MRLLIRSNNIGPRPAMPEDDAHDTSDGKLRLFVEGDLSAGQAVALSEGQVHYLRHVMRAKSGEAVQMFNGRDGEWRATLALAAKRGGQAVPERQTRAQDTSPDIWLCFAPVKKSPADLIAQKATELGASMLQPVVTRRTIVGRVNVERMRAIAIEAAEQSERLDVPACAEPVALPKLLAAWPPDRRLLFCDEAGGPALLDAVKDQPPGPWAILIGPEGGFDEAERALIRALPRAIPVSLGPRILRADTAALAALALLLAALGA
jgi:16S rRNA (uracil1498-N3)-methyltransferase